MKTYKEIDLFKKRVEKIESKLTDLQNERESVKREWASVEQQYESIIIADAVGDEGAKVSELPKLKRKSADLKSKLDELDTRIKAIEDRKKSVLVEQLAELEKGYSREMNKLSRSANELWAKLPELSAQYLLFLNDLGQLKREARELHEEFVRCNAEAGKEYSERFSFPNPMLFDSLNNIHLGVLEKDQKAALEGSLPPYVMLYQLTGEIDMSGNSVAKLAQARRKEK
ncbi:hypothetical protein [Fictibacillus gelatini]|uniref:hypothetical protein n=1 Tax=Fictibacillus gelatini TaxID=225985 RepID=UPI000401D6AC|nr:hypothetical protein [Fictibacillus gelatini]